MLGKVYMIPSVLYPDNKALEALPAYIIDAVKDCQCFFVENEKTARRFFKKIWKEIVIDDYYWQPIQKIEKQAISNFCTRLKNGENIGIISEAGCPGVADPGQILASKAQELDAEVIPLVGPNSILLALMASGMNGQNFEFHGYLPIDTSLKKKSIKQLEEHSKKKNCTCIFIETPYRNNNMFKEILKTCRNETKLCIAVDITSANQFIKTKTISQWQKQLPELHKKQAIFLLYAEP